jgi:hypothetical protein
MPLNGDPSDPLEARLRGAFSPQQPDAAYVSRAYSEFVHLPRPKPRVSRNPWVRLVAGLGGMLSLASVLLLIVKLRPVIIRRWV